MHVDFYSRDTQQHKMAATISQMWWPHVVHLSYTVCGITKITIKYTWTTYLTLFGFKLETVKVNEILFVVQNTEIWNIQCKMGTDVAVESKIVFKRPILVFVIF